MIGRAVGANRGNLVIPHRRNGLRTTRRGERGQSAEKTKDREDRFQSLGIPAIAPLLIS
jgi:hypothetical protein